ncbi:glycosyltransferase family 4 protein [Desulfovibrio sp. OttesenSCG-928-I05]|nr:glycosyltransferase family 4 protein [Desulfovibrio sp. OttesenSCG-928-I05]
MSLAAGLSPVSSRTTPGRIAVMLPRFSRYGGVEQFAWRLAEALALRGHSVDFLCARQEADAPEGVSVKVLGRRGGLSFLKMLWFVWSVEHARREGGYDLSISLGKTWNQDMLRVGGGPLDNYHRLSLQAYPAGPGRTLKAVSRLLSPVNALTRLVEKRQYANCPRIVAVSHLVREWICAAHPQRVCDDIAVVYNRPDPERFAAPDTATRDAARRSMGVPPECFALGTASTNFMLKGVGPLIEALALVPERVHLFVAGGRGHARYTEKAEALGVADRVHFLGKVADMPSFYHALDAFSLPTYYDACANATMEALACGLRVSSSPRNGASYFLPPENVTANPADPRELAAMITRFTETSPPPPFVWPENTASGLDAFIELVEEELATRRGNGEP